MPKNSSKQIKRKNRRNHTAVNPAPMLFKRRVTLTDAQEVYKSDHLSNGFFQFGVSANGLQINTGTTPFPAARVPQRLIWDQWAEMFRYYQVLKVHAKLFVYKNEYLPEDLTQPTPLSTPGALLQVRPVYSIIDPDSTYPATLSAMLSYNNCQISKSYETHHRSMNNYTDLGLSKQDHVIMETKADSISREQYQDAASICFLGQIQNLIYAPASQVFGIIIYTVEYEFSGQHAPGALMSGLSSKPPTKSTPYNMPLLPQLHMKSQSHQSSDDDDTVSIAGGQPQQPDRLYTAQEISSLFRQNKYKDN